MLLHALILVPFISALLLLCAGGADRQGLMRSALVHAGLLLLLAITVVCSGPIVSDALPWFALWGSGSVVHWQLGADQLSSWLVLLTATLLPVALIAARSCQHLKEAAGACFASVACINGALLAGDLVVFYLFYEAMLLPIFALILLEGDEDRRPAALRFLLFTIAASVCLLAAVWQIAVATGSTALVGLEGRIAGMESGARAWVFFALIIAFAAKVPLLPVHGWQARVYASAPVAGAVLLAGVMGKLGIYGFLRLVVRAFPEELVAWQWLLLPLAVLSVVYGALLALAQRDLRRLLAYSSLGHLALVCLGVLSGDRIAGDGALVHMLAHGWAIAALFLLFGWLEQATGERDAASVGGLVNQQPLLTLLLVGSVLASVALPGTASFVGEFLLLYGTWHSGALALPWLMLAGTAVILGAWYLLRVVRRIAFGAARGALETQPSQVEALVVGLLLLLSLVVGLHASPITSAPAAATPSTVDVSEVTP